VSILHCKTPVLILSYNFLVFSSTSAILFNFCLAFFQTVLGLIALPANSFEVLLANGSTTFSVRVLFTFGISTSISPILPFTVSRFSFHSKLSSALVPTFEIKSLPLARACVQSKPALLTT
jgi:hypothetical protein